MRCWESSQYTKYSQGHIVLLAPYEYDKPKKVTVHIPLSKSFGIIGTILLESSGIRGWRSTL